MLVKRLGTDQTTQPCIARQLTPPSQLQQKRRYGLHSGARGCTLTTALQTICLALIRSVPRSRLRARVG